MRSALYVPGNRPALFDKALAGPADVVLLDLEDSVPAGEKARARELVSAWLAPLPAASRERIWVRVNPDDADDLRAVAAAGPAAVCLAKTESADQVRAAAEVLSGCEPAPGVLGICPLLESATAVLAAREIATAPRVLRLQLGEADLCADMGMAPGPDRAELLAIRTQLVLVSVAAGIEPPPAPVSTDFRDLAALRESTEALARLGFRGRACIHPAQLPVVNAVFTPSADELTRARDLVARFDAAAGGVVLDADGRMVDLAVVRRARRLLADAGDRSLFAQ
ncbi:HpcH/HpaI aldolase/citrate lyase family protein [Nocardia nova]|jgi:citrate lyase subunit beta/citryl-CoA lyase|uniref:HpcH/HpaI aldolase/citrate lyase family protein n=1 Tax=Nocardia nova TaxID=37330 RepID=UPI0018940002|nr:CoA ester lyase [Nocardia nova]MBF6147606.1 CoA ester lyase [Nocardia nova]MDN2497122.1 CoA ester lyase [Nocardia nova]